MSVDAIGDFLTIIRNGLMRSKPSVVAPYSRIKNAIAEILLEEGFIRSISVENDAADKKQLRIVLKYTDGESVIHEITRVSKLGRRQYRGSLKLKPMIGNLGVYVLTTSKGVMTDKRAKQLGIGGEVVCSIW